MRILILSVTAMVLSSPCVLLLQLANAQETRTHEFHPRTVINRAIRPIVDAPIVAAADVTDQVSDNELVLGVVIHGEARAYPINMLTGPMREIVNDTLGGAAIAATW